MTIDRPRPAMRSPVCLASAVLIVALQGCQQEAASVELIPVKGIVTVDGQPAKGVYLQFHSLTDPARAMIPDGAKTDSDGSYLVPVHSPGEYAITAIWPEVEMVEGEEVEGADRFQDRFNHREQPVKKVTIGHDDKSIEPIDLRTR